MLQSIVSSVCRQEFPRFYFVSNSDMLEILGDARDPEKAQNYIKKCFQGIRSLDLVAPGRTIR